MKMIIIIFLLFVPFCGFSQDFMPYPIDSLTGKVAYKRASTIQLSKVALYNNAKKWIVDNYKEPKDVIQFEDKELRRIVLKTILGTKKMIKYTTTIDVRDGKYRIIIDDFYLAFDQSASGLSLYWHETPTSFSNKGYDNLKTKRDSLSSGNMNEKLKKQFDKYNSYISNALAENVEINRICKNEIDSIEKALSIKDDF